MNLEVEVGGIKLKNPVMTASGTFGYGEEYVETAAGMLNAIGLQNLGIDAFIREKMPFLRQFDTSVIVNFFGDSVEEYAAAASKLSAVEGIHGLEMNISCPNKEAGWCIFGTDPRVTFEVVGAVRKATTLPLIVKLTPNVTDITVMARAAEDAGADALSLINTLTGMSIDIKTRKPRLGNVTGGLSGPAIKPVAVRMVYEVSRAVGVPVIGMGGIMNGDDAVEFLIAGASAVAVGTANFVRPTAATEILDGMIAYMERERIEDVGSLTGTVDHDVA
ncbi:MAG: dihydroorotate dehydrogenase [Candidatus Sulfobium sp.]